MQAAAASSNNNRTDAVRRLSHRVAILRGQKLSAGALFIQPAKGQTAVVNALFPTRVASTAAIGLAP